MEKSNSLSDIQFLIYINYNLTNSYFLGFVFLHFTKNILRYRNNNTVKKYLGYVFEYE